MVETAAVLTADAPVAVCTSLPPYTPLNILIPSERSSAALLAGRFVEDEALDTRVITGFKRRLSDLEALARDDEGFIYAHP